MNRRASIEISFGMIFSIILVVALIGVAVYAILAFVNIGKATTITQFQKDIQNEIDLLWGASIANKVVEFSLPNKITHLCFGDLKSSNFNREFIKQRDELNRYASNFEKENSNIFLYPVLVSEEFAYNQIDKVDFSLLKNDFDCFETRSGRVKIKLIKEDFNPLVKITHE
jgi:hypothetical protein